MMIRRSIAWVLAVIFIGGLSLVLRGNGPTSPSSGTPEQAARLAWWRHARFGLFIHWGPVSLKGTEISWSRANSNPLCPNKGDIPVEVYDNLYKEFNPTQFNAAEWAAVAKDAGMRYVVLTAKHCDGFCLWPTATGDYHIGNSPFKRDVCGELAAAVRAAGLRIGWYYSPMDWRDPDCRTERNAAYVARMQGQVRELLTRFGRIDLLWFDWDGESIPWDQEDTYRIVREAQPQIIVNNRLDCSSQGLHADRDIGPHADYLTPEQVIGAYNDQKPWETCMTLGTQWSWKPNDTVKTADEVIRILANCAGGDGNLLLNVGPMPDGRIEPRQVEVLKRVGEWMDDNQESIYGTRGGPFKPWKTGASTRSARTIYVHIFEWPENTVRLPPIAATVKRSEVLSGGRAVVRQSESGLEIEVDPKDRNAADTVIVLRLDKLADSLEAVGVPEAIRRP